MDQSGMLHKRYPTVLLLGNHASGKSSLIRQYADNEFSNYGMATISLDWKIKTISDIEQNRKITLKIHDSSGLTRLRPISVSLCKGPISCCILVFDLTNRDSFNSLNSWRDDFLINADPQNREDFHFAVLGNKVDMEEHRKVSMEEAQEWCKMHDIPDYYETSAKDSRNLPEVFLMMARKAHDAMEKKSLETKDEPRMEKKSLESKDKPRMENKSLETKDANDSKHTMEISIAPKSTKEQKCILM